MTTTAEMTSVVVTTRSCSDRSQRARRTPWLDGEPTAQPRPHGGQDQPAQPGDRMPGTAALPAHPRVPRASALPLVAAPFMSFLR